MTDLGPLEDCVFSRGTAWCWRSMLEAECICCE